MDLRATVEMQNPWWRDPQVRVGRRHPFRRALQPRVLDQLRRVEDRRAVVLMGPRQVGKSVLLRQTIDDLLDAGWPPGNVLYFDFSDDRLTGSVAAREIAELEVAGHHPDYPQVLLLDEIARSPRWDLWLKQAVDQEVGRIAVTDSAATVMRQAGRESGVGRWDEHWLEALTFGEFLGLQRSVGHLEESPNGAGFGAAAAFIPRYLDLGGFPEHALALLAPDALRRLREQIVAQAILRDLGGRVRDPEQVRRLFAFLMQESGGEWNESRRAADLESDRRAVREWLQLLEDTLLIVPLRKLAIHAAAGLRGRPKLYAADHGLINAFALADTSDPEIRARVYEATVFRHLRELVREDSRTAIAYYRDRSGREVDFVLDLPDARVLIEVTGSPRVKSEKVTRLGEVARKIGADRQVLVYGGSLSIEDQATRTVPLGSFLFDPRAAVAG